MSDYLGISLIFRDFLERRACFGWTSPVKNPPVGKREQRMEDTHSQANGRVRPSSSGPRKPKAGAVGSRGKRNGRGKAPPLDEQLRSLLEALSAVRQGDFSARLSFDFAPREAANAGGAHTDAERAIGQLMSAIAREFNAVVALNEAFASQMVRVERVVGREGRMTERASLREQSGGWAASIGSINSLIGDLVQPTTEVARVISAVAAGDFTQKMALEIEGQPVKGEFLRIGTTVNGMVDQLSSFAAEVTRVAKEVGTDGKLGGQAEVPEAAGIWRDLTDNVNQLANNLTAQVRNIAEVTTAVARGNLSKKITVDAKGEVLELKSTINTMVDQLNSFSAEVARVAREVGTEGKLGGQADVKGVSGVWKDLTDNVNFMATNLTAQVRGIVKVVTAVANGDLSQKLVGVEAKGEIAALADTLNSMTKTLGIFAEQVTSVARTVGVEGKLGVQAQVPGVAGTWKDLTDNVNLLANNLTTQVRNIAEVTTAVATGDLSKKITVDAKGEVLELKSTVNTMVDQLRAFASEVTRVAREVGTEGKLGGQADVRGVSGTWKDLTDNVNLLAGNLTDQVRNIAKVTTAVANGDLSQKITVSVKGEISELKNTINAMVDQLNSFAAEVTRVAREVGTAGKLGGQAQVPGVSGTWKDLTDNVNLLAGNLTDQVRNIAKVTTAVANGDLSQKITVDVKGEILELKNTINTMVDQLRSFAGRGHARRQGGRHRRQAGRPGRGEGGVGRRLEGSHRQRQLDGLQPDRAGPQHRAGHHGGRQRRPVEEDHRRRQRGDPGAEEHHQHDGRSAEQLRQRGHARRQGGRHRGEAGRPGRRGRRRRRLEEPHRERQLHGPQPDRAGARHRQGRHRGRRRRSETEDGRRGQGGDRRAGRHHQQHDRHAVDVRRPGHQRGARGRHRGEAGRPGARPGRQRHLEGSHRERQLHGLQPDHAGARDRQGRHGGRQRRPDAEAGRRRGQGRDRRAGRHHQ